MVCVLDIARASIKRRTVTLFVCALMAVAGVAAYFKLGKLEDPEFTIKTAVVTVSYPGSSAYEVEKEVTSRVEDAVQAMGEVKRIRSRSTPGTAIIYVDIKDMYTAKDLPEIWNVLRQKIYDMQVKMPPGTTTMINNDFGDVYGQYYALVGDGYSMRELWDYADFLKKQIVLVPGVASVQIIGDQKEAVYVEFQTNKLASLGLSTDAIFSVLNQQNSLSAIGSTLLDRRFVRISPTGSIMSVEDIGELVVGGAGGRLIRLKEVADVRRDEISPPSFLMYNQGRQALGIGIATVSGGNVVTMGEAVKKRLRELEVYRPVGMELDEIYMQSDMVIKAIGDFIVNLLESLAIVVGVLLVFMGMRTGLMIGGVLLLTVAGTFSIMEYSGIYLQVVSLAALIIALGSLVDNAIVVAEGMLVGVERGMDLTDAASQSVEGAKWAMLGGTAIAVLAFAPIGLSPDSTGEFCRSLFQVVGISMMLSWLLAITVTPVFGALMLKPGKKEKDPYDRPLFRWYRAFLEVCLRHRAMTLAVVGVFFALSILAFTKIDQSFFPDSDSAYYTVDLWQPEGSSLESQEAVTLELAKYLSEQPEVKNVTAFIGGGSLRFMLTYSPPDPNTAYSQLLVEVKRNADARPMIQETQRFMHGKMLTVEGICKLFAKGSGMTPKLEARFYGPDPAELRSLAAQAKTIMEADRDHNFVRIDWREPVEVIRPRVMKDQMRILGLTRPQINKAVLMATTGAPVGIYRDGDKLQPILAAVPPNERYQIDRLSSFPVWAPGANAPVPLGTVLSSVGVEYEDHIVMSRNRSRVITVASDIRLGANADAMLKRIGPKIEALPLPVGYSFAWGGEKELQNDAMGGLSGMFLPCLLLMFGIMVFLFNGFKQPLIIFGSLPLILIGIAGGLLAADMSFSFLALLGLLSLVGMLAKNTIVMLDQVASDFASGRDHYEAIVETGVSRLRPVSMSAVTTVLGMVPLIWDVLFSSMAVTIMAGLTVSTILTLVVVPVLTAMAYHVPCPVGDN